MNESSFERDHLASQNGSFLSTSHNGEANGLNGLPGVVQPSASRYTFTPSSSSSTQQQQPPIDTASLAIRIRDLLIEHRIGQRMFAKVYLGITQQRLNNLLVKPCPWNKCDAFRRSMYTRMNEWSLSEQSIASLVALRQTQVIKSL
jgi:hypothetical protein